MPQVHTSAKTNAFASVAASPARLVACPNVSVQALPKSSPLIGKHFSPPKVAFELYDPCVMLSVSMSRVAPVPNPRHCHGPNYRRQNQNRRKRMNLPGHAALH